MSYQGVTIRKACQDDAYAIAAILRTIGWRVEINQARLEETEQRMIPMLLQSIQEEQNNTVLVAEQHPGQVIAYASVHWFPNIMRGSGDGYVSELFVHPDAAGKGIGSRLLDAVNEYARQHGCTRLLLVNRRDRVSYKREFYRKHGWEEWRDAAFFIYTVPQE